MNVDPLYLQVASLALNFIMVSMVPLLRNLDRRLIIIEAHMGLHGAMPSDIIPLRQFRRDNPERNYQNGSSKQSEKTCKD